MDVILLLCWLISQVQHEWWLSIGSGMTVMHFSLKFANVSFKLRFIWRTSMINCTVRFTLRSVNGFGFAFITVRLFPSSTNSVLNWLLVFTVFFWWQDELAPLLIVFNFLPRHIYMMFSCRFTQKVYWATSSCSWPVTWNCAWSCGSFTIIDFPGSSEPWYLGTTRSMVGLFFCRCNMGAFGWLSTALSFVPARQLEDELFHGDRGNVVDAFVGKTYQRRRCHMGRTESVSDSGIEADSGSATVDDTTTPD